MPRFCSECGAPLPTSPPVTCRSCDASHWLDARPCAGALVTQGGKLLLVRRAHAPWKGAWDLPSGFCAPREHPIEAAAREVREETALEVDVGPVLGMWIDSYAPDGPGADKVTLTIYFNATVADGHEPQLASSKVAEIGWFGRDELPEPLAFPGHVPEVLEAWRASQERPPLRAVAAGRGPVPRKPEPTI